MLDKKYYKLISQLCSFIVFFFVFLLVLCGRLDQGDSWYWLKDEGMLILGGFAFVFIVVGAAFNQLTTSNAESLEYELKIEKLNKELVRLKKDG